MIDDAHDFGNPAMALKVFLGPMVEVLVDGPRGLDLARHFIPVDCLLDEERPLLVLHPKVHLCHPSALVQLLHQLILAANLKAHAVVHAPGGNRLAEARDASNVPPQLLVQVVLALGGAFSLEDSW